MGPASAPAWRANSAPTKRRSHKLEDRLQNMHVVSNAKLIGHGQQQRIRFGDSFIFLELLDRYVRRGGVASAKNCPRVSVDKADLVLILPASSEIGPIKVVHQRKNAAADRNAWNAPVTSFFPSRAKSTNLSGLLNVERLARLI